MKLESLISRDAAKAIDALIQLRIKGNVEGINDEVITKVKEEAKPKKR